MAKANVFLLSIVLMASLASLSHGLLINGLQIGTLEVRGVVRCTLNGSDPNAPPLSTATVVLTCGGSSTDLGQATTNPLGVFTIVAKILETALFNPSTCLVTAQLPVGTCSVIPPDAVVTSTLTLVSVITTNVGNIARFVTNGFLPL